MVVVLKVVMVLNCPGWSKNLCGACLAFFTPSGNKQFWRPRIGAEQADTVDVLGRRPTSRRSIAGHFRRRDSRAKPGVCCLARWNLSVPLVHGVIHAQAGRLLPLLLSDQVTPIGVTLPERHARELAKRIQNPAPHPENHGENGVFRQSVTLAVTKTATKTRENHTVKG